MHDEISTLLGTPNKSIIRRWNKRETEELQELVRSDAAPHTRLRAALSINTRPPAELLTPTVISKALSLEDCWRLFRQLSTVRRVLDASSILEAIRTLLSQREQRLNSVLGRLIRISKQWDKANSTSVPSALTITQFLSLVEAMLDRHTSLKWHEPKKKRPDFLPEVLEVACRWAIHYPTVDNLVLALRSLTAAERRQGYPLSELRDERPRLADAMTSLRSLIEQRLEETAARAEIDDFRRLLRTFRDLPAKPEEAGRIIALLFGDRARFDPAISGILSETIEGHVSRSPSIEFASGSQPTTAVIQLATALLKAWSARDDGPNAREAYEQLRSALESFFSLRLRDSVGEVQMYNPRVHEFGFGVPPSSAVEVVRPSVETLRSDQNGVVIKALVRPVRS